MRLRSTRLASAGMGVGLPAPTARLDLTAEAAIDALSFSRTSGATEYDAAGLPRWSRENLVPNSEQVGAVVGVAAAGVIPNGWSGSAPAGCVRDVVAVGTAELDGQIVPYMDIRFYGTLTASASAIVDPIANTGQAAAPGQTMAASVWIAIVAGSLPAGRNLNAQIIERSSAGGYLNATVSTYSGSGELQKQTITRTLNQPTTAYAQLAVRVDGFTTGEAMDVTVRVAAPQFNRGLLKPYIPTIGAQRFMPRLWRDAGGMSRGLWTEPTAFQMASATEGSGAWTLFTGCTIGTEAAYGDFRKTPLTETATTGIHQFALSANISTVSGVRYASSVAVLREGANPAQFVQLFVSLANETSGTMWVNFDLINGTFQKFGSCDGFMVPIAGGYRVGVSYVCNTTAAVGRGVSGSFISSLADARGPSYAGTGKTLTVACPQHEALTSSSTSTYAPTSYIPNYGAAGTTVTRSADVAYRYDSTGPELVTNGTFDSNINGWTDVSAGQSSWLNGKMRTVYNGGVWTSQAVAVEIGKPYLFRVDRTGHAGNAVIRVGTAIGGSQYGEVSVHGTSYIVFTATSTTAIISVGGGSSGSIQIVDNISLKEAIPCAGFVQGGFSIAATYRRLTIPTTEGNGRINLIVYGKTLTSRVALTNGLGSPLQTRFDIIDNNVAQAALNVELASQANTKYCAVGSFAPNDFRARQKPGSVVPTDDTAGTLPELYYLALGHHAGTTQGGSVLESVSIFNRTLPSATLEKLALKGAA